MKPIWLDDMRERVGRAIFGGDWLRGVSNEDWALIRGPYGIKQRYRSKPGAIRVSAIEPCPPAMTARLDRAIGRAARADAQYSTVDSWIENHDLPVDPGRPADRNTFDGIMREEFGARPAKATPVQPGPKAKVLPRLMDAIENDITSGALTIDRLRDATLKELEARYSAKQSSVRDARTRYLATAQK
jgi:hypothetical protein